MQGLLCLALFWYSVLFPELTAAAISLASSWPATLKIFILIKTGELIFPVMVTSNWCESDLEVLEAMITRKGGRGKKPTKMKQWTLRQTLANSQC